VSGIAADEIKYVYEQLKDRYDLLLTTTFALDNGFTIDRPIVVGKAHGQIIWLYKDRGMFIMDVMDAEQTMGTHWHPDDTQEAVNDIAEFMDGKSDYDMIPYGQV